MADLAPNIETNAAGPRSVEVDGTKVESQSLKDQIEADKYLAAKAAAKNGGFFGLRISKIVPPGAP